MPARNSPFATRQRGIVQSRDSSSSARYLLFTRPNSTLCRKLHAASRDVEFPSRVLTREPSFDTRYPLIELASPLSYFNAQRHEPNSSVPIINFLRSNRGIFSARECVDYLDQRWLTGGSLILPPSFLIASPPPLHPSPPLH